MEPPPGSIKYLSGYVASLHKVWVMMMMVRVATDDDYTTPATLFLYSPVGHHKQCIVVPDIGSCLG